MAQNQKDKQKAAGASQFSRSAQDKRFLKKWATRKALREKDRALILTWIDKPDGLEKRAEGFWRATSKSVLTEVMYETAMERQRTLPLHEWVVVCLITQGIKQEEIADLLHKSECTVDKIVLDIKHRIVQELGCDVESVNPLQISRWFLGL
jgi:ATP/maltotriose-dependent transcriptional regulator MalT